MMYKTPATAFCFITALLHTTGVVLCTKNKPADIDPTPPLEFPLRGNIILPDINPTPPLEFPLYGNTLLPDINPTPPLEFPTFSGYGKIVHAIDGKTNNLINPPTSFTGKDDEITTGDGLSIKELIGKPFYDLKSSSQPINVIAKISENYTENYIENKYYNNHVDESWGSIALTLLVLMVMAVIVLACSALCLKKVLNLKISKRQLLIEDCDESAMSDLIHVQHV